MKRVAAHWRMRLIYRRRAAVGLAGGLLLLLSCCGTPIQVERADPRDVGRELDSNVISTGNLSEATRAVLRREDLLDRFDRDPEGAIASLHRGIATGQSTPEVLFALSEMSFQHGENTRNSTYFLASAVYAYAFLFPEDPRKPPTAFDPRFRTACNIYNRGLTWAFATADRSRIQLRSGQFPLPFGSIDITYDSSGARWGNQTLSDFGPAYEFRIEGLQIRYRQPGIGASLAADATPAVQENGFKVEPNVKVPVTALLRIDAFQRDLPKGNLHGIVEIHPAYEPSNVVIGGQPVPLESDSSAAFAFSLSDPKVWESEFAGFFDGDFFNRTEAQLVGLEPYRAGQIPVIFIHGTGSSSGRWADLINDLQSDPAIRVGYQFWAFTYATGNPTAYSAKQLREEIETAVRTLDPEGKDPALQQIVLIGHSQGGLLAKWVTIDSGSRLWNAISDKPPEELHLSEEDKVLLRSVFFVTPVPQVRSVIFMATPQHGSFAAENPIGQIAARLITPGAPVMRVLRDLTDDNTDNLKLNSISFSNSIWSMSPSNPFLQTFAEVPVSPRVQAHSIIAVEGDGPVESGDDGVVSYQSAHIPEAVSELVVRSGHSVQSNPKTVREVRRILLLHLAEACPKGCGPSTSKQQTVSPPTVRTSGSRTSGSPRKRPVGAP